MNDRQANLDAISAEPRVPVLIIGGGINGVGLLREMALQGVDALLVDRSDLAAGASSASSRMIHGGLRYLENAEFRLVRESLRERNRLLANARHVVRPLPTTIPIFSRTAGAWGALRKLLRRPAAGTRRGALLVKVGLTLYDLYAGRARLMPRHVFTGKHEALARRPALNPAVTCTATYYDAWIAQPERLCLELALDAAAAHRGARFLNYAGVVGTDGAAVLLRDAVTGRQLRVHPEVVVNATGAWIDFTNAALARPSAFIGGTKGSHVVVDHAGLLAATGGHMIYYENSDGRICILFPFHDKVLVGSTDLRVADPESAVCGEDEIAYIFESVRQVFPEIRLDRSQVVFRFCGVRPLPRSAAGAAAAQISRDHSAPVLEPDAQRPFPVISLVGGKWTTFRAFAEQVADDLLRRLRRPRVRATDAVAIGGAKDYPVDATARRAWIARVAAEGGLTGHRAAVLLERYGTRARAVAAFIAAGVDAPLRHHAGYSLRETEFVLRNEAVVRLDDLVLRRTSIALLGELTLPLLRELCETSAAVLGWDEARAQSEIDRTVTILHARHGVTLSAGAPERTSA